MYYDLKFPFRISEEAALAQDENNNWTEAYAQTTLGNCKKSITDEKYKELHELQRRFLAEKCGLELDWIVCITPEEYEANVDEEE